MPETIEIAPTQWTANDVEITNPETGEPVYIRKIVLIDPITKKRYIFPMPREEVKTFGGVLASDNIEEALSDLEKKAEAREKLKVQGKPTEEELRRMQEMAKGGAIPPNGIIKP